MGLSDEHITRLLALYLV